MARTRSLQEREDEVTDVSVGSLVFSDVTPGKRGQSRGFGDLLSDGKVTQTMRGASQLELDLVDRDLEALNSELFANRVDVVLDGVPYRLTEVSLVDTDQLKVVLEHRLIAEMRDHKKPLKVKRGTATRAVFVGLMLKELKGPHVYISPELHRKQPIKAATPEETAGTEPSLASAGRGPGIKAGSLLVKKVPASQAQLDQAAILLGVVDQLKASEKVAEAIICAAIGESTLTVLTTPNELGFWGVLQGSSGKNPKWPAYWPDPTDSAGMALSFCQGGKGFKSAIKLAEASPLTPGGVATEVEGSGKSGNFYGVYEGEARAIIAAYKASGGSFTGAGAAGPSVTVKTAAYEFSRGLPGKPEDTYVCGVRLAEEVLWRFFVVGRRSPKQAIYFVQDADLYKAKPRYLITPETVGVKKVTFDVEVGKRTVIIRGRRQPKPSEARLTVRLDRWEAPPGTTIQLAGYGPADQKWLVDTIERPLFDAEGEILLRAPQADLPEPRTMPSSGTVASSKAEVAGVAGLISPFPKGSQVTWGRSDQGVDGTVGPGSSLYAMGDGTVSIEHDPAGFGANYPVLHLAGAGSYYYGHCVPAVPDGATVKKGDVMAHANLNGQGNATTPGAFEIGTWPPGAFTTAGAAIRSWFTSLPRV